MKMKLLAGVALAVTAAASGAWASENGWYGAVDVGGHQIDPFNAISIDPGVTPFRYKTRDDVVVYGRIGYQLFPHLRLELEGGYHPSTLKGVSSIGGNQVLLCNYNSSAAFDGIGSVTGTCGRPHGEVDVWTAMGNALIDLLPNSRIDPFIGGGVGIVSTHIGATGNLIGAGLPFPSTFSSHTPDHDSEQFAYQGIGGISYQATDRLNIDLTYRYLAS
ncbi:MAG TPA: outer membrane beta-barrel protein, partial [Phenylobacterium sp.]|uniref:outer membrane protein n=1 Tax=Phenylobacterium sp. TaxID=1871053 RepID=UPI002C052A8C